jgi:hypothetical protein
MYNKMNLKSLTLFLTLTLNDYLLFALNTQCIVHFQAYDYH